MLAMHFSWQLSISPPRRRRRHIGADDDARYHDEGWLVGI